MKQLYIGIVLLLAGGTALASEETRYEAVRQRGIDTNARRAT